MKADHPTEYLMEIPNYNYIAIRLFLQVHMQTACFLQNFIQFYELCYFTLREKLFIVASCTELVNRYTRCTELLKLGEFGRQ